MSEGVMYRLMELGPEDVSLIREVSSCQRVLRTGYGVGT